MQSSIAHPVTAPDRQKEREANLEEPHAAEHLSPGTRAVWGIVSFVPLVSGAAFLGALGTGAADPMVIGLGFFTLLWTGLALLFFGNRLFKLPMRSEKRMTWGMALVALAPLALPAFWYRYIWSAPTARTTHA